jgi:2-methylcitrate dehydratase PrpD
VAPGQFHRRGFHPTGLFAPFGTTYLAGRLLGLNRSQLVNAAGIVGSFAAGILECWVDGTQSKFLHPGWARRRHPRLSWARPGRPVRERARGQFGLFEHCRIATRRAEPHTRAWAVWESRASFKPFRTSCLRCIDAALKLRAAPHRPAGLE